MEFDFKFWNSSEWLLLLANLLKKEVHCPPQDNFIEYALILTVDKGHFDGVNFF